MAPKPKTLAQWFRKFVNQNRRQLGVIETLDGLGFRAELTALYGQLLHDEPRCYLRERLLHSPYAYLLK